MKNFNLKKILLLAAGIIFLSSLNFYFIFQKNKTTNHGVVVDNQDLIKKDVNLEIQEKSKPGEQIKEVTNVIKLNVLGENYQAPFEDGDSVFDFMNKIKSDEKNNFNFKYKEYPSLGVFVSEINGVGNNSNKYWIYYVNDKEAEVGISKYILKRGDIISWQQK